MRQYFTYRQHFNNVRDISTPSVIFPMVYPEMKGIVEITDCLLSDEQMKVLPNGEISGVRIGWAEVNLDILAQFGHDLAYFQEELVNNGTIKIYLETNETLANFLRSYTNVREKTANVFVIKEEFTDMNGDIIPEVILDLN